MTIDIPKDFEKPNGLSDDGNQAWSTIMEMLSKEQALYSGGCPAFYSPDEWLKRGEEYGLNSVLIVCHAGGEHSKYFDWDRECYDAVEQMRLTLEGVGLFAEQCTGWYSAIYKSTPASG